MSDEVRNQLLEAYAGECRDHLVALRRLLGADEGVEDIEEAYRRVHSLKGAARAVDLPEVEALAHHMEGWLQGVWDGDTPWTAHLRRRTLDALDVIEDASAAMLAGPAGVPSAAALVRVEARVMDRLLVSAGALLGEAARHGRLAARARELPADLALEVEDSSWRLGRLAADIADEVGQLRLVAADAAFAGLAPLVRETAAACGRSVRVEVEGMETRADREVLQALREPVLHVLRNAVSHGIESPADRTATGKLAEGRVRLAVAVAGGRLRVMVEDDGRGFDLAALARIAVEQGILSRSQAQVAPPERLRALAFVPGLSTVDEVDTVAGRGMGMDIVRRVVSRLQGSVELAVSSLGGAAVVLTLPVTMTSRTLLVVEAAGDVWCLPEVRRLAHLSRADVTEAEGRWLAVLDGVEISLAPLASLVGGRAGVPAEPMPMPMRVAVVVADGCRMGLVVDRFVGVVNLPVAALDPPLDAHPLLAGSVVLGDGTPAFVLVPSSLAHSLKPVATREGPGGLGGKVVLVVDDSATYRVLLRNLLEAEGYRVVTVADGAAALEVLEVEPVDVVVSDIEMPRLDGFGLLAAVGGKVPVVLVTSRTGDVDARRAAELGAAACIAKQDPDGHGLRRILAEVLS
jgi:two-component system chemotaxis sensor kinase CheA